MSALKIRGGHRAIVVRVITSIRELFAEDQLNVIKIKAAVEELKHQQGILAELDTTIQSTLSEQELFSDMEDAMKRRTEIRECILRTETDLERIAGAESSLNHNSELNLSMRANAFNTLVRLPTMQLPIFEGNSIYWQNFWDLFKASIHNRTDLTDAQKFGYLKGQLKNEASQLLEGFSVSDAQYDEAVKLLTETYGKPHQIIQAHLHAIFDLESPKATASSLLTFRAGYESHVRGLKSLGAPIEDAGFVITTLLIRKLPPKLRDNINRAQRSDCWDLSSFRAAIDSEVTLLHAVEPDERISGKNFQSPTNSRIKNDKSRSYYSHGGGTTGSFSVHVSRDCCVFCNEKHNYFSCKQFKSPHEKYQRMMKLERCLNCLAEGHKRAACTSRNRCKSCNGLHHTLLCFKSEKPNERTDTANVRKEVVKTPVSSITSATASTNQSVALPIAMLKLFHANKSLDVRTLFDQGSQCTFILRSICYRMRLKPIRSIHLTIDDFSSQGKNSQYDVVEFAVETNKGIHKMEAVMVDTLPSKVYMPGITTAIRYLKSVKICVADPTMQNDCVQDIGLLVGADQYYDFVEGIEKCDAVHLLRSTVGNMVTGKLNCVYGDVTTNTITVLKIATHIDGVDTSADVSKLWELDSIGISKDALHEDELQVLSDFTDGVTYKDGHYVVRLPWRPIHPRLKTNYYVSYNRLQSLLRKLRKTPDYLKQYHDIMMDQLDRRYVEVVDTSVGLNSEAKVHYIPHHGVEKESLTTPLRIVFDCSSGNPSLNDCLYSGPSLMPELCNVLLRFRLQRYGCIADIAKAFLQVTLDERDRDSTRFLWPEDPWNPDSKVVQYRFRVVLFGATCSQFLLNATVRHHLRINSSEIATQILRNIYVDNVHFVSNDESSLLMIYEQAKEILSQAGLILREWTSNSSLLKDSIILNGDGTRDTQTPKYLGLVWHLNDDHLGFPNVRFHEGEITKRSVVSDSGKIFDPLGLLNPVLIKTRVFIQNLWKSGIDWDEPLNDDLISVWHAITKELELAASLVIPRQITVYGQVTIHAFCDASSRAYGTVLYFSDEYRSQFIMSKVKVAPIKQLTIPQLELTATTLAARLVAYVLEAFSKELKFREIICWSDSTVVLSWLQSNQKLKPYIHNRVSEVNRLIPNAQWKYVSSKENPADLLTRGVSFNILQSSDVWFNGPPWLCRPYDWPQLPGQFYISENVVISEVISEEVKAQDEKCIINFSRFSSLRKLIHTVVFLFRTVGLSSESGIKKCTLNDHNCSVQELENAERWLLQEVQKGAFSDEMKFLIEDNDKKRVPNLVSQLRLFLDAGLMRCRRRVEFSDLSYDIRYPILLPKGHCFINLIILDTHSRLGHIGVSATMNSLRQKYWIPKLRQNVKCVIGKCAICKKLKTQHYKAAPIPSLPAERVKESKPFAVTGIDFTGALWVKDGKQRRKVYVCLFTCAATRAIHLEMANDCSAESFMHVFKRFVGRRSIPNIIISDNAKNFSVTAEIIKRWRSHPELKSWLSEHRCEWRFIPSYSPWMGGFWERLIGLTKDVLKKILGRAFVSIEELRTIVIEVEAILNDRPLTWVSDDIDDDDALTPSHLMFGYRITDLPIPNEWLQTDGCFEKPLLTARQMRMEKLKRQFWYRWQREYLLSLRQYWKNDVSGDRNQIQVGDVVLIYDARSPKLHWKMGIIQKLHQGRDGCVRSVQLKTATGITNRAVSSLYPMEVKREEVLTPSVEKKTANDDIARPKRRAAIEAAKSIRRMI